ncbi:hypothetical protein K2173_015875 [Erythroxylum novogranatense]|uniref:RRM domain-containing protein n=1 Tax=Erythroxylum novogranatense TaxID=1862640 RepID=A0AAV8SF96_9ROSI|nr:hypothetical protein K2173_015875 [Erythroxylum novogranatense]
MATSVDMTLDDIIKKNRERGRGRGRARRGQGPGRSFGAGRMPGRLRKGPLSLNARASQYSIAKSSRKTRNLPWQHDLLEDSIRAAGITGVEVGTKVYISNLDYGVSNEDIRELFAEVGEVKRYAVHYDKTGRASGSAEVVYIRRTDALAALKKYNNVLLDGKPMKIEIMGASEMPISTQMNLSGVTGTRNRAVIRSFGAGRGRGLAASNRGSGYFSQNRGQGMRNATRGGARGRGRSRGRSRGGPGRGRKQLIATSADELDKELENYHAEAMQT